LQFLKLLQILSILLVLVRSCVSHLLQLGNVLLHDLVDLYRMTVLALLQVTDILLVSGVEFVILGSDDFLVLLVLSITLVDKLRVILTERIFECLLLRKQLLLPLLVFSLNSHAFGFNLLSGCGNLFVGLFKFLLKSNVVIDDLVVLNLAGYRNLL